MRLFSYSFALSLICLSVLSACDLAPDYEPPKIVEPPSYKEAGDWVMANPDIVFKPNSWWVVFGDPELNGLEDQVTVANQNLKVAIAQFDEARAAAGAARSAYFPSITGQGSAIRQKLSGTTANIAPNRLYNDYTFGADLSYEIDLWGRVRNTVASNEDQAEATGDDLAGVALSLHAELANDYFALRGDDESEAILDKTVASYQEAYDLTERRYNGGISPEADVDQAETQLENAKTQATDIRLQRALLEHAIAILTGKAPAEFTLSSKELSSNVPRIDAPISSLLLERRPDIAAAERRTAAANAEIGVARAAWFPVLSLTGSLGLESVSTSSLFTAPSQFWALGPSATLPLFDAGLTSFLNEEARDIYRGQVASYRETVLEAYGEVEDDLATLHHLERENKTQSAASKAAARALAQANDLYKGGIDTYLDVSVAQNNDLTAQLASVNIKVRRLTADVLLVEAIGGGWQSAPDNNIAN